MTNDDAIKIIKSGGWGYPENMVTEANLMAVDALERQTPQKFVYIHGYGGCPFCKARLHELDIDEPPYCPYCGQAIDWSEVE